MNKNKELIKALTVLILFWGFVFAMYFAAKIHLLTLSLWVWVLLAPMWITATLIIGLIQANTVKDQLHSRQLLKIRRASLTENMAALPNFPQ